MRSRLGKTVVQALEEEVTALAERQPSLHDILIVTKRGRK